MSLFDRFGFVTVPPGGPKVTGSLFLSQQHAVQVVEQADHLCRRTGGHVTKQEVHRGRADVLEELLDGLGEVEVQGQLMERG
jgi:hypothetical protein